MEAKEISKAVIKRLPRYFSKDCAKYGTFRTGEDLAQQKKLEKALNIAYHEKQICRYLGHFYSS